MIRALCWFCVLALDALMISCAILGAQPAHAQDVGEAPACPPWEGAGLVTGSVDSPVVLWAGWWCKPAGGVGEWARQWAVYSPSYWSPETRAQIHSAWDTKDMLHLLQFRNYSASHPEVKRSALADDSIAKVMLTKPPSYYPSRVAVNLSSTSSPPTRPAYAVTAEGARGSKEVGRAIVGAGCNPSVRSTPGGYAAFAPNFSPDWVTLCK